MLNGQRSATIGRVSCAAGMLFALGACTPQGPAPQPLEIGWTEVALPMPPGPPGRLALREAADCVGRWYVTGAVVGADGESRPAAWDSSDGKSWRGLTFEPLPTSYYGPRNVVYSLACRDGQVAMIGAKSGGVHGNPRVSTWYLRSDGVMAEVGAAFTLFGGSDALNVGRLAAGPAGFLIVGNRASGAAVWLSPDAREFRIVEAAPVLASDPGMQTAAQDAVASGGEWVVVGGGTGTGRSDRDPIVWTSADGVSWRRPALTGDDTYEELQRVVRLGDELVAVGLRGATFGAWRGTGGRWEPVGRFGGSAAQVAGDVRSVTVQNGRLLVAANDGSSYALWTSTDGGRAWARARVPTAQPAGADRTMAVAGRGDGMLLLADDGKQGRLWIGAL